MFKIKSLLIIAALILPLALSAQVKTKTISIKGHVKFNEPKFKMGIFRYDGSEKITVAEFDIDAKNNFEYKLEVKEPGVYILDCKKWESVSFWAEDENVEVNFRGKDTAKMVIKNPPYRMIEGSGPKNEVMNHLNYINYQNYQMMIAISQTSYRAKFVSEAQRDSVSMAYYDILNKDYSARVRFIASQYSDRTSVLAILKSLDFVKDKELVEKIKGNILKKNLNYKPLKDIIAAREESIIKNNKVKEGNIAPDFEYDSPEGVKIGPKSFRGKILVIDFWASWCGPCRQEIPNMKKAYDKYKAKGVEFLSVSIDKGQDEWRKALNQEGMSWPQILAPKAGKEITELYQFSGIPFIIILDREGKIYAKHLRGEKLDKAIEELLVK